MEKKAKTALESGVLILIVAGILVAINALSALGVYARKDVTKAEKFTLSKGSANLLRSMKQELEIDAYVTKGLPQLDAFVRDLRDLLQEYKNAGGNKFTYAIIEAKDEDTRKKAKDAGLVEQPFLAQSDTEEKLGVTQGFMGLVLKYGEQQDVIKFLSPNQNVGIEFWITNKIRELRDKGDDIHHKIGVLTGHDEIKLTEENLAPHQMGKYAIQGIITQNFPFYSFQDVDLKSGDAEIADELDGLIVTQPAKDLTEKELRRIDQFMMKGKSLVVFAGSANVKANDATMNASLNMHGLEKLLDGYGIGVNKDVVVDLGAPTPIAVQMQTGQKVVAAELPQVVEVQDDPRYADSEKLIDTSFPPLFRMDAVVAPFVSSVTIKSDKQPKAKVAAVMRTSPRAVALGGDSVDLAVRQPKKWIEAVKGKQQQQYAIGAQVDGVLASAFKEGDKQGVEAPAESAKPARVFVLASSQFLANPLARAGNGPDMGQFGMMMPSLGGDEKLLFLAQGYLEHITGSIIVFKNTLDWLSGDTDLLAASAKLMSDPNLAYGDLGHVKFDANMGDDEIRRKEEEVKQARSSLQRNVEWLLIAGIPALLAAYGITRWRMRLAARANVSLA